MFLESYGFLESTNCENNISGSDYGKAREEHERRLRGQVRGMPLIPH